MQLAEISIRRPVFATVLSLLVLLIGAVSFTRLSVREYPKIDEPVVTVSVRYPGASAEVIESHFADGSRWGARITYARQEVQDGTGRAPGYAREFLGDSEFLLTYGDILVRPETYQRMRQRWIEGDFAGLITVTEGEDVTKGGLNFFDDQFRLTRLVEKPSAAQLEELRATGWLKPGQPAWYNAGIYLFRPSLFEFTSRLKKSPRGEYELTDALSDMLAAGLTLAGLKIEGRWVDVRDPAVLASLQSL